MTDLERRPRTKSDAIPKDDAMAWLEARQTPSPEDILDAIVPMSYQQRGNTFAKPISDVRVKGDANFVETIAGLLRPFLACEAAATRLEIKLQKVKDKDTGKETDTWALYLKSVERGPGRQPRTLDAIPDDLDAIRK